MYTLLLSLLYASKMAASQNVLEWSKQVIARRSQIRTSASGVQLVEAFNSVGSSVQTGNIMQYFDTV